MKKLDWNYIEEILATATEGGTGCDPELFDGGRAWAAIGRVDWEIGGSDLSDDERQEAFDTLNKFHVHTGVLFDMHLIEVWDTRTMPFEYHGHFTAGDEYWPKRVTARGYNFLSTVEADRNKGGKLLDTLSNTALSAVQRAVNAGFDKFLEQLTGAS